MTPADTTTKRLKYSHYNRLMQELRTEDENAFFNFVQMLSHMFNELLHRNGAVIQMKPTQMRQTLVRHGKQSCKFERLKESFIRRGTVGPRGVLAVGQEGDIYGAFSLLLGPCLVEGGLPVWSEQL